MPVTLPTVDPNVTTAIAAAGGAILIKIVERWLGRRNENNNEAERIRKELREELTRYRTENIRLEKELDDLRTKYWSNKRLHDSAETRINDLESEVSDGAILIQQLSDSIYHLQDDVKRLREE